MTLPIYSIDLQFFGSFLIIGYLIYLPASDFIFRYRVKKEISKVLISHSRPDNSAYVKKEIGHRRMKQYRYAAIAAILGCILIFLEPIADWEIMIRLLILSCFGFLGFRIPIMQEESLKQKRRAEIEDDFSSVIDLLVVMLESGATFDEALSRFLSDKYFPNRPIKQELAKLAHELTISPDRQRAFDKFAETTQLNILRLFNSVLVQSELYGTPVSRGLRGLAAEMRQKKYNALEAKSSSLGPKLTIPMTLFFMPLIFIIVLAPTIIRAFKLS